METRIIDGCLRVVSSLGEGAAGEVVEATLLNDTSYGHVGERFAVKIYKPWVLSQKDQAHRIERELRAGNSIRSQNIVRTYEVGGTRENPYLVMQYLPGSTLRHWLTKHPSSNFEEFTGIAQGIAAGISTLHSHQLVHRDIKPENVMVTPAGAVILDLGVLRDLTADRVTTGREFLGTIKYAAPEYLLGEDYGPDIDVYSLGLILLELATGRTPYPEDTYWSLLIVKKSQEEAQWHKFKCPRHWTLRQKAFVRALFRGCLVCRRRGYDHTDYQRLSSEQVHRSFSSRVWEHHFAYPLDPINKTAMLLWPGVSQELEMEVARFASTKLKNLTYQAAGVLWEAASECHGNLYGVWKKQLLPDYDVIKWMEDVGLVERELDDYVYSDITPLAWQLLLRGLIQPPPGSSDYGRDQMSEEANKEVDSDE